MTVGRYRTIVVDPPWRYETSVPPFADLRGSNRSITPYPTLTVEELFNLPVQDLADRNAHLYLWTTSTHVEHVWSMARRWGFKPMRLLIWCKKPRGSAGFPVFASCTEFILFCQRGTPAVFSRLDRNWFEWPRGKHSAKPEAFIDLVEQVSPPPYVELFARRQRLGWDTWGNECFNTADFEAPA